MGHCNQYESPDRSFAQHGRAWMLRGIVDRWRDTLPAMRHHWLPRTRQTATIQEQSGCEYRRLEQILNGFPSKIANWRHFSFLIIYTRLFIITIQNGQLNR